MLEEGKYKATKIVGWFIPDTAEGKTESFGIDFELENGQEVTWTAYLSKKEFIKDGKTTTMADENEKTLARLGFIGRDITDLADDNKNFSDLFVQVDNINIIVEHEEYTKDDGQTVKFARVKFVNIGSGPNKLDKKQAVVRFKGKGFGSSLLKMQKELGLLNKNSKAPESATESDAGFSEGEVPF